MGEYYTKVGVCYRFHNREKLFLLYTYRCNAACAHCLTESNPHKTEKMSVEMAKSLISDGREAGKRFLTISGGEPMLFYDEVLELTRHARDLGYYVSLGTNGFWAKTAEDARRRLLELRGAGLGAVFPTSTAFHTRFVPAERVANVMRACEEVGVECEVNFYESDDREEDRRIYNLLGLDGVTWYTDGMLRTGKDISAFEHVYVKRRPADLDDCGSVFLSVTPSGDAICNCNVSYKNTEYHGTPFYLGNVNEKPFREILRAERECPILNTLYDHYMFFHEMFTGDPALSDRYMREYGSKEYLSLTEFYLDILKDPFYREHIQARTRAACS